MFDWICAVTPLIMLILFCIHRVQYVVFHRYYHYFPRLICFPNMILYRLLSFLSNLHKPKRILELGTFTGYSAICMSEGLSANGQWYDGSSVVTVESDAVAAGLANEFFKRYEKDNNKREVCSYSGGRDVIRIIVRIDMIFIVVVFNTSLVVDIFTQVFDLRVNKASAELSRIQHEDDILFDMVFLDADKKSYVSYLRALMGETAAGDRGGASDFDEGGRKGRRMLADGALIVTDNILWKGLVLQEVTTWSV
jgi:predicted O-methyltransferase YrrM